MARSVFVGADEVTLSSNEFDLLFYLACRAGEIQSRETLYQQLYKRDYDGLDRTLDVRVSHLRKKLGDAGAPERIRTVWGTRLFVRARGLSMARHFLQLYFAIVATLAIVSWGQDRLWHPYAQSAKPADSYPSQTAVLTHHRTTARVVARKIAGPRPSRSSPAVRDWIWISWNPRNSPASSKPAPKQGGPALWSDADDRVSGTAAACQQRSPARVPVRG